jgi:outer membrane protein assembly factor BamB
MTSSLLVHAHDGALVGIDRASGHPVWRCALPNVRGRVVAMAIDAELVVAACEDGSVFGVDYATGVGRWQAQFETRSIGGVPPTVFVDAGEIYVGYFGCVTRLSREGQRVWAYDDGQAAAPCALGVPGHVVGPHRTVHH